MSRPWWSVEFMARLFLAFFAFSSLLLPASTRADASYDFRIEPGWVTMPDGIRLSMTTYLPVPKAAGEKFPVLFEMLPYRKDDFFCARDYSLYAYFVRRGFVLVKVDVRGTGSSAGRVPDREYSDSELADAVEVIRYLSKRPWSNGRVGMWGISWSGFNALQVAMRQPPGLAAILVAHATDDLYKDDVHYIDGARHFDLYALEIDHDNGMPASPDYLIDDAYFTSRFDAYPWILTYLKHQRDGDFWRSHSLRWNYGSIKIPVFMIGGLLDGYRDFVPRMLQNASAPMKAVIGPWNHAWPDNGVPGPNFEWRREAVRWWDQWLRGKDTGLMAEPRFAVFQRAGHAPDAQLQTTPGEWRYIDWPVKNPVCRRLYPASGGELRERPVAAGIAQLPYQPASGIVLGYWWGEPSGDMREVEGANLIFNSAVLEEKVEVAGFPKVRLRTAVDAPLAHWVARLEDVQPDGRGALAPGGILNGSQRDSRLDPQPLLPGKVYDLALDLHFTTWTFRPGHRIRLTVANAAFPMIWPTPDPMTMQLHVGSEATSLELPLSPAAKYAAPGFLPPEPREEMPGIEESAGEASGLLENQQVVRDLISGTVSVAAAAESLLRAPDFTIRTTCRTDYRTNERAPAASAFFGAREHLVSKGDHEFRFMTTIDIRSDRSSFFVVFRRELIEAGRPPVTKEWRETIARDLQ
jgi:uncharacterized protein